jgi:hypothetical protein
VRARRARLHVVHVAEEREEHGVRAHREERGLVGAQAAARFRVDARAARQQQPEAARRRGDLGEEPAALAFGRLAGLAEHDAAHAARE